MPDAFRFNHPSFANEGEKKGSRRSGSVLWQGARAVVVCEGEMLHEKNANRNWRNLARIGIRETRKFKRILGKEINSYTFIYRQHPLSLWRDQKNKSNGLSFFIKNSFKIFLNSETK